MRIDHWEYEGQTFQEPFQSYWFISARRVVGNRVGVRYAAQIVEYKLRSRAAKI
jgi:hypothetical protein